MLQTLYLIHLSYAIPRRSFFKAVLSIFLIYPQDFGDIIPGHGGIMDRFDCQYLMATFVNVYISSFIHKQSPQKLLQMVSLLYWLFG